MGLFLKFSLHLPFSITSCYLKLCPYLWHQWFHGILDIHMLQLFTDSSHIFCLVNTSYLLSQVKIYILKTFLSLVSPFDFLVAFIPCMCWIDFMISRAVIVAMLRKDKPTCFMVCCFHMWGQTHPWHIWFFLLKYLSRIMTRYSIREVAREWRRA